MITAFDLAGFFAAHAIWCVSDGEMLIPMLAYTRADGERRMDRLAGEEVAASVAVGKQKLASNEVDANDAAILYDGRIPIGQEKVDAIIVEVRAYFSPESEAVLAIPYTPKASGYFRVHKPKLLQWKDCDDFDLNAALHSFFEGAAKHEEGSAVWNNCLDESK